MRPQYDYIIVGAGSSGCVLANRLSEDPRVSVLLVESGPDDTTPLITMPMGLGKLLVPGSRYIWEYAVSPRGNRPPEPWVKGRVVGGSSSINGMVYTRGTPADYDGWEAAGCPGWGWDEMGRCFREIEDHELGATKWRGVGGPLHVSLPPQRDAIGQASIDAAREAGTPTVADINDVDAVDNGGYGWQPRTILRGQRFSAARAFLKPVRKRANLDVLCEADVLAITFEGRRASGVRLREGGVERTIAAARETILSAGALHSPALLQRSGIGPARLLGDLGITPLVDAPEVGANLQDHRTIPMVFTIRRGGSNPALRGFGLVASTLRYLLLRQGALAQSTFYTGGFVKTRPDLDRPDAQIGFGPFSMGAAGIAARPGFTLFGYTLRPESRGTVAIASADAAVPLAIDANYLATEGDRHNAVALMRYMRRIAAQPALARHIVSEDLPGPQATDDEALVEASFQYGTTGYHVAGTCRMGSDDRAVVDPQLRVRGVDGLRVVDTSVMPRLTSANTNAPAMAIAWRVAEMMLQAR